jgi:hypothetical protein
MRIGRGGWWERAAPARSVHAKGARHLAFTLAPRFPRPCQRSVPADPVALRFLRWSARLRGSALRSRVVRRTLLPAQVKRLILYRTSDCSRSK